MPLPSITSIAFAAASVTTGSGEPDPEATLALVAHAERLGFDSAWVSSSGTLQGAASTLPVLAAASQRTRRIELGMAVVTRELEHPDRLAADLRTADLFARGRVQVEVSATGPADRGEPFTPVEPFLEQLSSQDRGSNRTAPPSDGPPLAERLWFGGGDIRAAAAAGRRGLHLLAGSTASVPGAASFHSAQRALLATWRAAGRGRRGRRVVLGRVIAPTDSAGTSARARLRDLARSRSEQQRRDVEPRGTWSAPDLIGSGEQILDALLADPILAEVRELRVELPEGLGAEDHHRILEDFVSHVAPGLGWAAAHPAFV